MEDDWNKETEEVWKWLITDPQRMSACGVLVGEELTANQMARRLEDLISPTFPFGSEGRLTYEHDLFRFHDDGTVLPRVDWYALATALNARLQE